MSAILGWFFVFYPLHPVASGPGELFEQSWIHQEASDIRK